MTVGANSWFRRRAPRLSGTLHIRDADGHELTIPLRGRDTLLTAPGSGLPGYGEAWAVTTETTPATTTAPNATSKAGAAGKAIAAPGARNKASAAHAAAGKSGMNPGMVGESGSEGESGRAGKPSAAGDGNGVMIVYGPTESVDNRRSGLCLPGRTITLGGVDFTWLTGPGAVTAPGTLTGSPRAGKGARIPAPRTPARNVSPGLRDPRPRATNVRAESGRERTEGGRAPRERDSWEETSREATGREPASRERQARGDTSREPTGWQGDGRGDAGREKVAGLGGRFRSMVRMVVRARVRR